MQKDRLPKSITSEKITNGKLKMTKVLKIIHIIYKYIRRIGKKRIKVKDVIFFFILSEVVKSINNNRVFLCFRQGFKELPSNDLDDHKSYYNKDFNIRSRTKLSNR